MNTDPEPQPTSSTLESAPSKNAKCRTPVFVRWARVMTALLALLIAAGHASALHPIADVLCSFQLQYFVLALLLTVVLVVGRSWRWAIGAGACVAATGALVLPWYVPNRDAARQPGAATLRLMLANVCQTNTCYDDVCRQVDAQNPDVVILQEVNAAWLAHLQTLAGTRPHTAFAPGDFLRGNAIFSRYPLSDVRSEELNNRMAPTLICRVHVWDQPVTLVVTHPWPPADMESFQSRNEQLARVALLARDQPNPRILVGDLNATMWSSCYRRLEAVSGLQNVRRGHGILPTFPMDRLPLLRVPIDHCLISADLTALSCRQGALTGSDHARLVVELAPITGR